MKTIFKKHFIQNPETKKKCRVHYSLDNRGDGRKCVTIYAKTCLDEMSGIISFENHSDPQSDYIVGDIAVIFEGESGYEDLRLMVEKMKFERGY